MLEAVKQQSEYLCCPHPSHANMKSTGSEVAAAHVSLLQGSICLCAEVGGGGTLVTTLIERDRVPLETTEVTAHSATSQLYTECVPDQNGRCRDWMDVA